MLTILAYRAGQQMAAEDAITAAAINAGLIPAKAWIVPTMAIFEAVRAHKTVLVVGSTGAGKTSMIRSVVSGLVSSNIDVEIGSGQRDRERQRVGAAPTHRLYHVHPAAMTSDQLHGYQQQDGAWQEGLLTSIFIQVTFIYLTTLPLLVLMLLLRRLPRRPMQLTGFYLMAPWTPGGHTTFGAPSKRKTLMSRPEMGTDFQWYGASNYIRPAGLTRCGVAF